MRRFKRKRSERRTAASGVDDIAVSVKGLRKNYADTAVLDRVNICVKRGEIFSLLGSNGAGKTTTIRILSTLMVADGGEVRVCGYDVAEEAEEVRGLISLTGQFSAVDETLTGKENLVVMGKLRHLCSPEKRAEELLEYFDLSDSADRAAGKYSGGMKRKLDIAMSLVGEPAVIFLDEPTTGLDPQSRQGMWKLIRELRKSGVTIFLTTQYLEEAEELSDRVAILHKGRIAAEGTTEEMKHFLPQNAAQFMFACKEDFEKAQECTKDIQSSAAADEYKLTLLTDGNADMLAEIFYRFHDKKISVRKFQQKEASLEDVFLSIVASAEKRECAASFSMTQAEEYKKDRRNEKDENGDG